jgi:outer membrane protein
VGGQDAHITNARAMGQSGVGFDASVNAGAMTRVGLGAQKPIQNPALEVQSRMLDALARMGEVQWQQAEQDLAWRTIQSYFAVLTARQTVEVLQRQSDTLAKAQKEIARRQAIGDATTMDVQEAQTRVALLHAQILQAQQEVDALSVSYRQLTGQMPQAMRPVSEKRNLSVLPTLPLPQWLAQALAQSTQLQLADMQIGLQEEEAKRIRLSGTAATVDWVGHAQFDRLTGTGMNGSATQQISGYLMGVQWSTPLGTQNLTLAREQEALKQADKLRSDKVLAQSQIEMQVTDAWQTAQSMQARLQALSQAHSLSQQRLRTTRQAHQVGTRSTLEWLGAEQDAAQAELMWRQMRIQVLLVQAKLAWVSGALGDTQLQQINQQLQ